MLNTIGTSWSLIKSSAKVLSSDKELIIFPIISSIGVLFLSIVFFVPMLLTGFFDKFSQNGPGIVDYLILFFFYLLQYLIIFLSNTALVGAAMIRIRGGDPTVKDGLKIAYERFVPVFYYSLIAATVGLILNMIRNKGKGVGSLIVSIVGMVWNVATFLVVPILAIEDVGPIEAIKKSVAYLKKTWGEQLAGSFSISAVFSLAIVVIIVFSVLMVVLLLNAHFAVWTAVAVGGIAVLLILFISLISSALNGIYTAAVYQFAVTGDAGSYFDPTTVREAFHTTNKI
jgi:hypothetical protein